MLQIVWKDDQYPTKTVWVNRAGELVAVVGFERPEGCREPTLEEADRIFRNRECNQFIAK
jgi:hypothetical protein